MAAHPPLVRRTVRRTVTTVVVAAAAVAIAVATSPPAAAADPYCTVSWTGGTGAWTDPTRWSTGTVPTADDFVCVLRPSGGPSPLVNLGASTGVNGLTVVGGTLRLPAATTTLSSVEDVVLTRATVAGRGTLAGSEFSALRFDHAKLSEVDVTTRGSLFFTGTLTFTAGARLTHTWYTGITVFVGDVTISDGDGDPGNAIVLEQNGFDVAEGQTVSIEVPLTLRYSGASVEGTLRLSSFGNLDAGGVLQRDDHASASLTTYDGGTITLPRSVTAIGTGSVVDGTAALLTPDGGDALADLTSVAGSLTLYRPLTLPRTLDVTGAVAAHAPLTLTGLTVRGKGRVDSRSTAFGGTWLAAALVQVDPTASFGAQELRGRLQSAGTATIAGADLGGLRLGPTARTALDATYPTTVDHAARLDGTVDVWVPPLRRLPPDGGTMLVLTAAGGVSGSFTRVTMLPRSRAGSLTLEYTPTQVLAVYHAP